MPRVDALPAPQLVFVLGEMRNETPPLSPFSRVMAEAGAHPFLYAEDSSRAIIGAVASGAPRKERASSVLPALTRSLRNIEIVRAPLDRVRMLTPFRIGAPAVR